MSARGRAAGRGTAVEPDRTIEPGGTAAISEPGHAGAPAPCLLGDGDARTVLDRAIRAFPHGRLALVSAFGPGSIVLIHMLADRTPAPPVVFIDTLHHFPETLELAERARKRYGFELRIFRPAATRETFEARHGPRLWERDLDRYQQVAKVEPFRRAIEGLDAYITGRRRDQSPTRAALRVVEPGQPTRINPLAAWSGEDVWRFIREHGLPYNPLHDRGYASIGDAPLTTRVLPGEHARAGRWRGRGRFECGIHAQGAAGAQAEADEGWRTGAAAEGRRRSSRDGEKAGSALAHDGIRCPLIHTTNPQEPITGRRA